MVSSFGHSRTDGRRGRRPSQPENEPLLLRAGETALPATPYGTEVLPYYPESSANQDKTQERVNWSRGDLHGTPEPWRRRRPGNRPAAFVSNSGVPQEVGPAPKLVTVHRLPGVTWVLKCARKVLRSARRTLISHRSNHQEAGMKRYVCDVCGYVYDPKKGDPDHDVAPGTPFEDLPDDWVCPECGVKKEQFSPEE